MHMDHMQAVQNWKLVSLISLPFSQLRVTLDLMAILKFQKIITLQIF